MCVWEGESGRAPVCLCVFLLMFVRKRARTWDENPSFMCACVRAFVFVCVWLDRGVLYWKVLLSSPVQHAGLAPAVSHGAVPPSPPAHLHKAQTGGDVTNKPGTHSAGCLSYVNSFASFSPWQEQNTQDSSSEPTCMCAPRDKDVFPESKLCCINKIKSSARLQFEACIPPGDHSDSQVQECERLKEVRRAFVALSFGQNSPWIKVSSPSFFPLPPRW